MSDLSSVEPKKETQEPQLITLDEFLENHPPGSQAFIQDIAELVKPKYVLIKPDLQLHCPSEKCGGVRTFACVDDSRYYIEQEWQSRFLTYRCRNCEAFTKTYALFARLNVGGTGEAYKIGEYPSFGPPLPSRLISMIGHERELFLKGRRSENQSLGVGAFAYYRRVVEHQWRRLLEDIIRVAERTKASQEMISVLRTALTETQFSKAVEMIKQGIPEALKIDGHNPLTLLHRALSEGLHEQTDEYCLEIAGSIRVILAELADRIGQALKDEREIHEAMSRLLGRKNTQDA